TADLKRFIDDRPILARRPTLLERAARWSRRHRPLVATAASVLFVALVVGTALLWAAKHRTEAALQTLQENRNRERYDIESMLTAMDGMTYPRMMKDRSLGRLPD